MRYVGEGDEVCRRGDEVCRRGDEVCRRGDEVCMIRGRSLCLTPDALEIRSDLEHRPIIFAETTELIFFRHLTQNRTQ